MFGARIVVPILLTLTAVCSAQSANSSTATCTLDDGRQVRINYTPVTAKDKTPNGKPWSPGRRAHDSLYRDRAHLRQFNNPRRRL